MCQGLIETQVARCRECGYSLCDAHLEEPGSSITKCPDCHARRSQFSRKLNTARLLNTLLWPCPVGCGEQIATTELENHIARCRTCRPPVWTDNASLMTHLPGITASDVCSHVGEPGPSRLFTASVVEALTDHRPPAKKQCLSAKQARQQLARCTHKPPRPTTSEACHDSADSGYHSTVDADPLPINADMDATVPASLSNDTLIPPAIEDWLFSSLPWGMANNSPQTKPSAPTATASAPGLAALRLQTEAPPDDLSALFPPLTPASRQALIDNSPVMNKLWALAQKQQNPLSDNRQLQTFCQQFDAGQQRYLFHGSRSLVIRFPGDPDYILKLARSKKHIPRFEQELTLYRAIQEPGYKQLAFHTCPLLLAFRWGDKPVMAMSAVDFIADRQLEAMGSATLFERLDFALTWVWRFAEIYQLFLQHGILLGDRHGGNIGFNENRLPEASGLGGAVLRLPVMLDLDPYWQKKESGQALLYLPLPVWTAVAMDLLERAFCPGPVTGERIGVINRIRALTTPATRREQLDDDTTGGLRSLLPENIPYWQAQALPHDETQLVSESGQWLPELFSVDSQFDRVPRPVSEWIRLLEQETARVLGILQQWQAASDFSLMATCSQQADSMDIDDAEGEENGEVSSPPAAPPGNPLIRLRRLGARLQCGQCQREFYIPAKLQAHLKQHQHGELEACSQCGKHYRHQQLQQHMALIHSGPQICRECGNTLPNKQALATHNRSHHSGERTCTQCQPPVTLNSAKALANHNRSHHSGERTCTQCQPPVTLNSAQALADHNRSHHSGERTCTQCQPPVTLNSAQALANHNKSHHSGERTCTRCQPPVTLNSAQALADHNKSHHSGERTCTRCQPPVTLNSAQALASHNQSHHSGERTCTRCQPPVTLKSAKALARHNQSHHSGERTCTQCQPPVTLNSAQALATHNRSHHSGERTCTRCQPPVTLNSAKALANHNQSHHSGERTCTQCQPPVTLNSAKALTNHKFRKHRKRKRLAEEDD